jgi:hypothetical protein
MRYLVASDFRFGLSSDLDPIYAVAAAAERERCSTVILLGDVLTEFVVAGAIPQSRTWQSLFAPGRYLNHLTRRLTCWWVPGSEDAFIARRTFRKLAQPVRVAKSRNLLLPTEGLPNILFTTERPQPNAQPGPWGVRHALRWLAKADPDLDVSEAVGAARLRQRARLAAQNVPLVAFVHAARHPYAGQHDDMWCAGQVGPRHAIVVEPDGRATCQIVKL